MMNRSWNARALRAWACVFATSALGACSAKPSADSDAGPLAPVCPMAVPSNCPSPPPTWTTDIQTIIEARCYPCHGPGGVEQSAQDFTSYQGTTVVSATIDFEVFHCLMPPPDAGAATPAEQLTILTWILCGTPND